MSSLATPLIAGFSAIAGAVAGAAAAGYWSLKAERARQAFAREERERRQSSDAARIDVEVRTAATEIMFELQIGAQIVEAFLLHGRFPQGMRFRTSAWNAYRSVLIAALPTAQWLVLARVFIALEALEHAQSDDPDDLDPAVAASLRRSLDASQLVLRHLTDLPEQEVQALLRSAEEI